MITRDAELLKREQRAFGADLLLLRYWETTFRVLDVEHDLAVLVYAHGYKSPELAGLRSVRFAVYDGERHVVGGCVS